MEYDGTIVGFRSWHLSSCLGHSVWSNLRCGVESWMIKSLAWILAAAGLIRLQRKKCIGCMMRLVISYCNKS